MMGKPSGRGRPRGWTAWLCGVVVVGAALSGASGGAAAGAATVTAPRAPKITSATPGLSSVTLAFKAPADGGARILSYRATCTSSNGGVADSHQDFNSPIRVAGLTSGKTYRCTVAALNRVGFGPASTPSTAVVALPTAPPPPKITSMTPGWHSVTIAFAPTTDGGAPILNYLLVCSVGYGTRTHQGFTSPVTIACVGGGEPYLCTVAAENRVGWGHASPTSPSFSLPVAPSAPTITSVKLGLYGATVAFTTPANDGGASILNYRVTCTSSNGGITNSHQAFNSPISVTGLSPDKTYTCTVAAINQVGIGAGSAPSLPFVAPSP
ncbi:MAG: fibronectin type III domain-containing protein [Acidimicrobiia bacterium]